MKWMLFTALRVPFSHKHQDSNVHIPDVNQSDTVHHFFAGWDVTCLSHCLDSPVCHRILRKILQAEFEDKIKFIL